MKISRWQIILGLLLAVLSTLSYFLFYLAFEDKNLVLAWFFGSISFLPLEILLVILIVSRLLSEREKRLRLDNLNMVIGAFFSEVGTALLTYFSDCDPRLESIKNEFVVTGQWTDEEYGNLKKRLKGYSYGVDIKNVDLEFMKIYLAKKRNFMLRLTENPNLLEHETFTDLLRSVFHLTEELEKREEVTGLPSSDLAHLENDTNRAYMLLVYEWIDYMRYLKNNYPYLFHLAMRLNPFDEKVSVVVK